VESVSSESYLVCRARSVAAALWLPHVVEVMRPLPLERLADMPRGVLGLSIVRGVPTLVLDAGLLLGATDEPRTARLVTLRAGDRQLGLALEEVLGVRRLDAAALRRLPPLVRPANEALVSAIAAQDAELLLVLEAARALPDSTWRDLDARRGPT
jgi:purine-binding chemotaxis protein CheW